jgi:glycogen debranching enzyme
VAFTILEGATFCICDDRGDVGGETSGFFAFDTRFLSQFRLTINGERPLLLSAAKVEYFSAAFYLRNPLAGGLPQDTLSIARRRFVGEGMQDRILIRNEGMSSVAFDVGIEFANDFADILSVKEHDFALGDPMKAPPLPATVPAEYDESENQFLITDAEDARTQIVFSQRGRPGNDSMSYSVELDPRETWELQIAVVPSLDGERVTPRLVERRFGDELLHVRESLAAWRLRVPQLRAGWDDLGHSYNQSVADLAALRMRSSASPVLGSLPAAGMPWFMTVFGRDTIITCLQTLLFGPDLARAALDVLASLQSKEDNPAIDAEPGKIVHEIRTGKAAEHWFASYYGTVDATPLYLILLSEVWRWTDDAQLVRRLREPAMLALRWIDEWGDRDGDGFVEYERRSPHGLDNHSWKDSGDSQRFSDGRLAEPPIAPAEVQGYVYDAKRRTAELARAVWRDRALADRLMHEANELRDRFDDAFWIDERGGYFALALDKDKRRVDSMTSNIGHLLWSGIVKPARVDALVDALMSDALWSGWGVRTMSQEDAGYNPLSYHNGTVWPHDNSLIATGLARYNRWPEAQRIIQRMLNASRHFGHQLPEVFAGLRREETSFPIAYPTAARPQAWAAGAPVLLLQTLLGLQPDPRRHALESVAPQELPSWTHSLRLQGVQAFDGAWDVWLEDGHVRVVPA